jgi:uncharacterized membrane protein YphA (DoxX/SURF4 family)
MFRWLHQPDVAAVILRLMLAGIFIGQAWIKLTNYEWGTTWYKGEEGMDARLQTAVAIGEMLCGLALAVGLLTRVAALGVIVIMIGALYMVTWRMDFINIPDTGVSGFGVKEVGFAYNYAIAAMAACLVILGGGVLSFDHFLWRRAPAQTAPPHGAAHT